MGHPHTFSSSSLQPGNTCGTGPILPFPGLQPCAEQHLSCKSPAHTLRAITSEPLQVLLWGRGNSTPRAAGQGSSLAQPQLLGHSAPHKQLWAGAAPSAQPSLTSQHRYIPGGHSQHSTANTSQDIPLL